MLLLLGLDLSERQSYSIAPVVARMCAEAGWLFDLIPRQAGPGRHFGGGQAQTPNALGSSYVGGRHADQIRILLEHFHVVAIGDFSRAVAELLAATRPLHFPSNELVEILLQVAALLDSELPQRLIVLDASAQGRYGINTAAYQYPALLRSSTMATDVRDYEALRSRFVRLGVKEHESLFVSRALGEQVSAPEGPKLERQTYAEYTGSIASENANWAEGLLLGDPRLILSSIPRAAELRLAPLYGRPQVQALSALEPSPRWTINGAWGRQFDDRDFGALSKLSIHFQLIDVGPPFHTVRVARSSDTSATQRIPPASADGSRIRQREPNAISDRQLREWAEERRVLASLVYWCGMTREVEAVERVADLVAMTGLKAGIALTATAASHLPVSLPPLLLSCEDAGGRLEVLLASLGDGIMFECDLGGTELSSRLIRTRRQLESLTGQAVHGWWPLLDGKLREVRRTAKLREGRVVLPRAFAGRADEDRPAPEARLMSLLYRARIMQARPAEWVRPEPPSSDLMEAVRSAGFDYVVSKSKLPEHPSNPVGPTLLPTTAMWGGWTPFRTVATAKDFARLERQVPRHQGGVIVATVDTALWLQSGEAWRRGPQMQRLAQFVADGGRTGGLINVAPEVLARYLAILERPSDERSEPHR